jgi:hypothetical protein
MHSRLFVHVGGTPRRIWANGQERPGYPPRTLAAAQAREQQDDADEQDDAGA